MTLPFLSFLDSRVAFAFLELIAFLALFQIPYLQSPQMNSILLLFFHSKSHNFSVFCQHTLSSEVEPGQVGKRKKSP